MVILSDGQVEHIRTSATERSDAPAPALKMATAHRGWISGNQDETTRNIGGQVFGTESVGWVRPRGRRRPARGRCDAGC
jgi:hypothetical protein